MCRCGSANESVKASFQNLSNNYNSRVQELRAQALSENWVRKRRSFWRIMWLKSHYVTKVTIEWMGKLRECRGGHCEISKSLWKFSASYDLTLLTRKVRYCYTSFAFWQIMIIFSLSLSQVQCTFWVQIWKTHQNFQIQMLLSSSSLFQYFSEIILITIT